MEFNKNCLLNVRDNPPWKNHGDIYYQDLVVIYIELNNEARAQMIVNNLVSPYISLYDAINYLNKIIEFRKEKGCKTIHRTVVWVNGLHIVQEYFNCFKFNEDYFTNNKGKKLWRLYNDEFEIRNFNIISNSEDLKSLKKSCGFNEKLSGADIMKSFLLLRGKQGLKGWAKINYSFAYCANKLFFKGLENLKYKNEKSIPNLENYRLIQRCNKSGLLDYMKEYKNVLLNEVTGWDMSSAYPAQFINQKMPIGKFMPMPADNKSLKMAIDNDWSFLVEIKTKDKLIDIARNACEEKDDGYYYVMTDWDVKRYKLLGVKVKGTIINLRVCKEKDYLDYEFRKRIVEYYEDKQNSKGVNNEMYFEKKTTLDAIWGKGLQEFNPESEEQLRRRYYRNHNRYLLPQWSLWGAAATRYEMAKAIKELIDNDEDDFVACDTDGIKFRGEHNEYFEKRNKEIIEKNAAAGFPDCEIGTWKFEGCFENFIQFGYKQYAFSLNGELTCKFAGCSKDAWKNYFKDKSIEECFELLSSEDIMIPAASKKYNWVNGNLLVVNSGYKPGDENLETYQVKAV